MTQIMKTVILEKQAHQSILLGLLKESPLIGDTSFISLDVFLNQFVKEDRKSDWFKVVAFLEQEAEKFDILKTILRFPITAQTLLSFINTMADEGWSVENLPQRNKKELELKAIIKLILSQKDFDRRFKQWAAVMTQELHQVEIYDHFYPYPIQKRIDQLIKKGFTVHHFSDKNPQIKAFYTNNPRSEVQACVQTILEDEMPYDDQVIVCMDPSLQSQVETFLLQYDIPYFRVNEYKTNAAFRLVQDLIELRLDPSNQNLIKLIQNDLVDTSDRLALMEYLQTFQFDVADILQPLTHVKDTLAKSNIKDLLGGDKSTEKFERLEKKAERGLFNLRTQLIQLMTLDPKDYELFISDLFNIYVGFFKNFNDEEVESINKVKQTLENAHPYLKTMKDPYLYLLFSFSKLTLSNKQTGGVILTDLKHAFIPNKKRVFILSCTQEFYPQNPVNTGLFDDDYRLAIVNDAKERYDYHKQMMEKLRSSYEIIIYSYPLGSYDGKKKEYPNELGLYFGSNGLQGIAQRWKLIEKEKAKSEKLIRLSKATAEVLFFKEQELYGSVSSFEKFFHCPYQYFLTTGIGLRSAERYQIDAAMLGTLYHYVLEKGIAEAEKDYAQTMFQNETQYIAPLFEDLKAFYPRQSHDIELMKDRALNIVHLSLEFLIDRELMTSFKPAKVEESFNHVIDLERKYKLHLNGFIDRIDKTEDGFMIIDYKSSTKRLREANVMIGLQLQLATYMWMCDQFLELGLPYGAYYFSFGQDNLSMKEFDYKLTGQRVLKEFDGQKAWFTSRRLCGWTTTPIVKIPDAKKPKTDDTDLIKIDHSANHIVGWKINANGSYSVGPQFDAEKIYMHLKSLYGTMIDELMQAKIERKNLGSSCQYCDFKHFCQFKGQAQKAPKVTKENAMLRAIK